VSCFVPNIPHTIIIIHGEKGAAKSTVSAMTKSLIDPSALDTLTLTNDHRSLVVSLQQHWYLPFDNVSYISEDMSDMLCRASTGGAIQQRKLNTNAEDTLFIFRKCIAFNGIHNVATYVPVADGYKNGMAVRNSQSVSLQRMGFGKDKNSINEWRKRERQILKELCQKYDLEIAEESQGRGKTFTPDEYKKIRDEAKEELKTDPEILDEIKDEIRADVEDELLSEQRHLVDEITKQKTEVSELQQKKSTLQKDLKQEQKNFTDMQVKFKPRQDDLKRVLKLAKEVKPAILSSKVNLHKDDWDFIVGIAKQHARISDTTLAALESHSKVTAQLKRCQSLYLAVASEVAALGYSDRTKIQHSVQDVLKDIEDWRVVAWLVDDMAKHKPSNLDEILQSREAKMAKKFSYAKKVSDYNQPSITPIKAKKHSHGHDR
jgi:hypothetical protein